VPILGPRSLVEDFPSTSAKPLTLFSAGPYGTAATGPFVNGAPWAGHDSVTGSSAGSSSSRSLIHQAGIPTPTVGSLYNGHASAVFNPSASEGSGAMSVTMAAIAGVSFTGTTTPYPFSLNASGVWVPDYPGTSWSSSASNGTSGSRTALTAEGTGAPAQGVAQNGHIPPDFTGGTALGSSDDITNFVTTSAGGVFFLYDADTLSSPSGTIYQDSCVFTDGNGDLGIAITSAGATAFAYDGSYELTPAQVWAVGGYNVGMMRWNGTTLGLTVNSSGTEQTIACNTLTIMTGPLQLGEGYGGLNALDGRLLEIWFLPFTPTRQNFLDYITYCDAQYSLSL
jgi:hypothetical protein